MIDTLDTRDSSVAAVRAAASTSDGGQLGDRREHAGRGQLLIALPKLWFGPTHAVLRESASHDGVDGHTQVTPSRSDIVAPSRALVPEPGHAYADGTRRAEVLETAASLIATSGLRTSMHDIARAAGIQTGSLYHHFASKEALLVELLRRYHTDLDRVAEHTVDTLDDSASRPGFARITALGIAVAQCAVAHRAAIQTLDVRDPE